MLTPRIVYGSIAADGSPPLPAKIGATPLYSQRSPTPDMAGPIPYWQHMHQASGILLCVGLIAQVDASHAVWVAWSPNAPADVARWGALAPALKAAGVISSLWLCDADGLGISAVEADMGTDAAAVMAAWPASWRYWQVPPDVYPDPMRSIAGSGPSGARCLPVVLV